MNPLTHFWALEKSLLKERVLFSLKALQFPSVGSLLFSIPLQLFDSSSSPTVSCRVFKCHPLMSLNRQPSNSSLSPAQCPVGEPALKWTTFCCIAMKNSQLFSPKEGHVTWILSRKSANSFIFFSLSHEHWVKVSMNSTWIYLLQQQMGFKGLVVLNIFILKYMLDLICFKDAARKTPWQCPLETEGGGKGAVGNICDIWVGWMCYEEKCVAGRLQLLPLCWHSAQTCHV